MSSRDLLHPELHAWIDSLIPGTIDETTLGLARKELAAMSAMVPTEHPGCEVVRTLATSEDGYAVPLVVVRPTAPLPADGLRPAISWTHGGGYLAGHAIAEVPFLARLAAEHGMVGVSVDYRLAPEHPHPAPVEDGYAGLTWLHEHAGELGVDAARIAVGGESAGGGLAAAVSTLARDRGGPAIARQLLVYPMLDDRTAAAEDSSHEIGVGEWLWSPASNRFAWRSLLGGVDPGSAEVSPYASPARAGDLRGLPATFLDVGDLDLFAVECLGYAQRLVRAGVPTDLHLVAGAVHGYVYAGDDLAVVRAHRDRVRAFFADL
ncbi:MAG TPA: alpha/beta hydrolase [Nocardioides sp.]|nr:alpha/beta hydrolase [Nocardioides sp.]